MSALQKYSVFFIGVGISNKTINRLFNIHTAFSQLGTNKERGTGLGLILCKEFVELHEGKIIIESTLGEGTKFEIILPLT